MIYKAAKPDIDWMVKLSHQKRSAYEKAQPHFWKMVGDSDLIQKNYFLEEIVKNEIIALCYENNLGFIIGKLVIPPEVYDAGLTLMIDDFCVSDENLWMNVGKELLQKCIEEAKVKGAKQALIVCGNHDLLKEKLLDDLKLKIASNWYVGEI